MLSSLNEVARTEKYLDRWLPPVRSQPAEVPHLSLSEYIHKCWHVVEPGRSFMSNWHIDLMSDYLENVFPLQNIRNLIINIPPGAMKSLMTSVLWPTWIWTQNPEIRFLTSSYASELAVRDAVKSRRIIRSKWYQARWGSVYKLAGDQNVKHRYENDKTGYRISFGVSGLGTGERADVMIVDDPLKAQDAFSDAAKLSVNTWWDETMSTRDGSNKSSRVIIMQRLAEDDLTGHVLEAMQKDGEPYEHLCLPMEYEPKRYFSTIGKNDPRTTEGECLWNERFPPKEVKRLQATLGDNYSGQCQQRPTAKGGAIYQAAYWDGKNRYDPDNPNVYQDVVAWFLVYDTALKDEESNDYTAHCVGGLTSDYRLLIRWVGQDKLQFPQLTAHIQANARYWQDAGKRLRAVVIEDKVSGTSAIQTITQTAPPEIAGLVQPFTPKGSKEYRAKQASVWCERGCVLLPEPSPDAPWLFDLTDGPFGIYKFPRAAHDDMVDAFTMLILYCEFLLAEGWQVRVNHQLSQAQA